MLKLLKELRSFTAVGFRTHLEENILPYWMERSADRDHGGFYGRIDEGECVDSHADKFVILNTRILWAFSASFSALQNIQYRAVADRAYAYLKEHFVDQQNGGVFMTLDHQGKVKDTTKSVFGQAFAIYAFVEYYRASSNKDALMLAIEIYNLLEDYALDQEYGGYISDLPADWLINNDDRSQKLLQTHLHVMEAYTNLLSVWPDEKLQASLISLIELFLEKFVSDSGHIHMAFDKFWTQQSRSISFGHDMESGWLLYEAARVLGDEKTIKRVESSSVRLIRAGLVGFDKGDGALMSGVDEVGVWDKTKYWWPQAEAMIGLMNASAITHDERYKMLAKKIWHYIQHNIVDHDNGEWKFKIATELDNHTDKVGPWKGPYHNSRAMLQMMKRLD